jgi:hypothetical protein
MHEGRAELLETSMLSRLGRALTARALDARRRALLAVFRDPPGHATLAELLEAVAGTPYEAALKSLTIGELVGHAPRPTADSASDDSSPVPGQAEASQEITSALRRVRTRAEKLALDTAVLDVLRASPEGLDLPALGERVQATEAQTRASVDRLLERDRILVGGSPDVPIHRAR